jgi:hypothetical protein
MFDPLIEPRADNRFGERTVKYLLPRLWNELPMNLKKLESKNEVKLYLKKLL